MLRRCEYQAMFVIYFAVAATATSEALAASEPLSDETAASYEREIVVAQEEFLKQSDGRKSDWQREIIARSPLWQNPGVGIAVLRKLRKPGRKQGDGLDRAYLAVAAAFFENEKSERCIEVLEEVVKQYSESPSASRAMLALADAYQAKQDSKTERAWLQRCADFELTEETRRGLMDTDNTRAQAIQRLAAAYQNDGDYVRAFAMWQSWQPQSWCGNCLMEMYAARARHKEECLSHIPDHGVVAHLCWENALNGDGDSARNWLIALYRDAKQLDDLALMIDELERREAQKAKADKDPGEFAGRERASAYLRGALKVELLSQKPDLDGLAMFCSDQKQPASTKEIAAKALGDRGEKAVVPIQAALRQASPKERRWLIEALSNNASRSAALALAVVAEGNDAVDDEWFLASCIANGPDGREVLGRIVRHPNPDRAEAAAYYLENLKKHPESFTTQRRANVAKSQYPKSKPEAGSLPKQWNRAAERDSSKRMP